MGVAIRVIYKSGWGSWKRSDLDLDPWKTFDAVMYSLVNAHLAISPHMFLSLINYQLLNQIV